MTTAFIKNIGAQHHYSYMAAITLLIDNTGVRAILAHQMREVKRETLPKPSIKDGTMEVKCQP